MHSELFWLHIKKSAGQSTRKALFPLYQESRASKDRSIAPIDRLARADWNAALNDYRRPIGRYQFRRCLYARDQLWRDDWNRMLRLGFARNPVSRAVSMATYLFDPFSGGRRMRTWLRFLKSYDALPFFAKLPTSREKSFDLFLEALLWQDGMRSGPDASAPFDLHFSTHTNPVSNDVLDDGGTLLLSHLVRLEDFEPALDLVFAEMGMQRPPESNNQTLHRTKTLLPKYVPSQRQVRRIEQIFAADMDLYENALRLR